MIFLVVEKVFAYSMLAPMRVRINDWVASEF